MDERFSQLFVGSDQSHGVLTVKDNSSVSMHTEEGPATEDDYHQHLAGKRGLGLVPVRTDGSCRFAAIDIDIDNINHQLLYEQLVQKRVPLTCCRSKSGGAHLYMFMAEPGIQARVVVPVLKRWAGILGYPTAEIFPKQLAVSKGNKGNWINLPFFGGDATTRYAIGPNGSLNLDEFLSSISYWDGVDSVSSTADLNVLQHAQMPPCLQKLTDEGLPEGQRNNGIFQFAVFYRKSSPNGWEDKVRAHNQSFVNPPLPRQEIETIIKSAGRTKYQYACQQEPIKSRCDRTICSKLPFGVNFMPWQEAGTFDDFQPTNLRKIDTDPPRYILEIAGRDVTLDSEHFFNYRKMRDRLEEVFDLVLKGMKEEHWSQMRRDLHQSQTIIEAPDDASEEGSLMEHVMDFLGQYKNSRSGDDLLKGMPISHGEDVGFRVTDLQRFLKLHRRLFVDNQDLFKVLHTRGCKYQAIRVKGKVVKVWLYPIDRLNVQTEEFDAIKFSATGEDL